MANIKTYTTNHTAVSLHEFSLCFKHEHVVLCVVLQRSHVYLCSIIDEQV